MELHKLLDDSLQHVLSFVILPQHQSQSTAGSRIASGSTDKIYVTTMRRKKQRRTMLSTISYRSTFPFAATLHSLPHHLISRLSLPSLCLFSVFICCSLSVFVCGQSSSSSSCFPALLCCVCVNECRLLCSSYHVCYCLSVCLPVCLSIYLSPGWTRAQWPTSVNDILLQFCELSLKA